MVLFTRDYMWVGFSCICNSVLLDFSSIQRVAVILILTFSLCKISEQSLMFGYSITFSFFLLIMLLLMIWLSSQTGGYQYESVSSTLSGSKSTERVQSSAVESRTVGSADWPYRRPLPVYWRQRARWHRNITNNERHKKQQPWRKTICCRTNGMLTCDTSVNGHWAVFVLWVIFSFIWWISDSCILKKYVAFLKST